jgi:hypothetical protein
LENGFDLEAWLVAIRVIEPDEEITWYYDCTQGYRHRSIPALPVSQSFVSAAVQAQVDAEIQAEAANAQQTVVKSVQPKGGAGKTAAGVARRNKAVESRKEAGREAAKSAARSHVCVCFTKCVGMCVNAPLPEGASRKRLKKKQTDE